MICFFHDEDLDGRCAGALVRMAYPDCEMIGLDNGEAFPWTVIQPGETVYVVDLGLPAADLLRLHRQAHLVWIDHHAGALEEWRRLLETTDTADIEGLRRTDQAACELTWLHLHPGEDMPLSVHLLGRYDVWDHTEGDVVPFQRGMQQYAEYWTHPTCTDFWRRLITEVPSWIPVIIQEGRIIDGYVRNEYARYARKQAFETDLDGLRCIAANRLNVNAELFREVADPTRHDAVIKFGWNPPAGAWRVTLYAARPEVDVLQVARRHGGSGHTGAAGFICDVLPFRLGSAV